MVSAVKRFDQALRVGNVKAANDNLGPAVLEWRKTGPRGLARRQLKARSLKWAIKFPHLPFPEGNPPKTSGGSGGGSGGKGGGGGKPKPSGSVPDKPGGADGTRAFVQSRTSAKKNPSNKNFGQLCRHHTRLA